MQLWHLTPDAQRVPHRVSAGDSVVIEIGAWPIEPGQSVWVATRVAPDEPRATASAAPTSDPHLDTPAARAENRRVDAVWQRNEGENSYWRADLGTFPHEAAVRYEIFGRSSAGDVSGPVGAFTVGVKLHLALVWHQHQPLYKNLGHPTAVGSYVLPWVRLHALRDYYSMAALVVPYPDVHLTINLTPVLLWQLEDYLERGATDRALDLTWAPAESLGPDAVEELVTTFFEADRHHQITPHLRYAELFAQRQAGIPFSAQDVRDLQMWFNLAWFGHEFHTQSVALVTGEEVSVWRFIEQARDFTIADIEDMIGEQYKVLRAVVPLHRMLQDRGQIEVSATPFCHPILPLVIDTDAAVLDRAGTSLPMRFAHPEDAVAQTERAIAFYERTFGIKPRGMWPAEGAVSEAAVRVFGEAGMRWIATDGDVLGRSGRWGYNAKDPDVLCQPWAVATADPRVGVFFRDASLSDRIGFQFQSHADYAVAAREFLGTIRERYARRISGSDDRVLTVILDGENAWGAYRDDARPFLVALYELLSVDREIGTITPGEFLDGNDARALRGHAAAALAPLHDLRAGTWADAAGSAPGVDFGTWIGEPAQNRAWELLGRVRSDVDPLGESRRSTPLVVEALHAAEGSDWFWWYADDKDSGHDAVYDALFRGHLAQVYTALGVEPPGWLAKQLVAPHMCWSVVKPVAAIRRGEPLTVENNCAADVHWRVGDGPAQRTPLQRVGGPLAGIGRHVATLGPFADTGETVLTLRLECTDPACDGHGACCRDTEHTIAIVALPSGRPATTNRR